MNTLPPEKATPFAVIYKEQALTVQFLQLELVCCMAQP